MTDTNTAEREAFSCCNTWFESLPEGRKAVLRDDKWMLAHAAFEAGRASLAASAVETKRYADGTTATGIGPLPKHSPSVQHALRVLTDVESMLGGANGPTIQIRAVLESLAASAGSEPVASDGWLHQDGLLYRLTDERRPCNRDEINVTMADGSRSIESRSRRALELLDRIRATHPSPPEGMAGWKDIATAPRDGTPIWLYTASGQCEGYWNYGEWVQDAVYCTYDGAGGPAFQCNPTHWQPLPAPPLPASEAKEAT